MEFAWLKTALETSVLAAIALFVLFGVGKVVWWYLNTIVKPESTKRLEALDKLCKSAESSAGGIDTICHALKRHSEKLDNQSQTLDEIHRAVIQDVGRARHG